MLRPSFHHYFLSAASGFALLAIAVCGAGSVREEIARDQPEVHWSFDQGDGESLERMGPAEVGAGPRPPAYPLFGEENEALILDGSGGHGRVRNRSVAEDLQFRQGETIAIECWVDLKGIGDGENQYLVGKGRTYEDGVERENQNWALRLRGEKGQGKISFVFRSRVETGDGNEEEDWHRWTSKEGFAPGSGWHHVAVVYTFGDPESLRGYLDGEQTSGRWDMGGATARPPVVDDGRVWVGSSRGGSPGNSLNGAIDEVAVYRKALSAERLRARYAYQPEVPEPLFGDVPGDRVLVEIFDGVGSATEWPRSYAEPTERFTIPSFALFGLPNRYGSQGERLSRKGPFLLRLSANIHWSAGTHRLLLRAAGKARIWRNEQVVYEADAVPFGRDAHGRMRPPADGELVYPRARLGTHDSPFVWESDGGSELFVMETLVGFPVGSFPVYELLIGHQAGDRPSWGLLAASLGEEPSFTALSLLRLREGQEERFSQMERERRTAAQAELDRVWGERHEAARAYVESLPPIPIPEDGGGASSSNEIDLFLAAKIARANGAEAREAVAGDFSRRIRPLLEENCIRCHGEKAKGGLRLDSRAGALAGGESGKPAIVPGDIKASALFHRVKSADEDERMPPKGDGLTREQIDEIGRWISGGAVWQERHELVRVPDELDETSFLRRIYLDTVGVPPTVEEIRSYLANTDGDKKRQLIDRLLNDRRHADHWVSYWQDVLAENPNFVKPSLNNTGPFRHWIYESLLDNKPLDQFVTELATFRGSAWEGGAGGFKIATQNDAPMAAKAHVIGTAFLGVEMKCARCHDAPYHSSTQEDLFSLAAMLEGKQLELPASSTVPAGFFSALEGRPALITASLEPGASIPPRWPFEELVKAEEREGGIHSREWLAQLITRPENERFAQVIVNRVWQRYFGQGFVEPVHDWEGNRPSHPDLLEYLGRDFVAHGYDLKRLVRKILNSAAYSRQARLEPVTAPEERFFEAPLKRRFTAEQLVDSLFQTAGVPMFCEELTLDVEGFRHPKDFQNFGQPGRAWQLASPSTERDRPSLLMPHLNGLISLMETYGWRANRAEPLTVREAPANVLQSSMLANASLGLWLTRLSDYSEMTRVVWEADDLDELIEELYLRFLTRRPSSEEREVMRELLEPGFDERKVAAADGFEVQRWIPPVREVSWSNHFDPKANVYATEYEDRVAQGPAPSAVLQPDWRERMEDAVWALINSPEFQFVP